MSLRIVLLALFTSLASAPSFAQKAPPGWRFLLQSDWGVDADRVTLNDTRVRGDFNGDGRIDHARMLVRKADLNRRGVFVFLMLGDGQQATVKLLECPAAGGCADHALTVVRKGCYQEKLDNVRVCLRHQGLVLLEIEYGYGTLYWLERGKWRQLYFSRGTLSNYPQ